MKKILIAMLACIMLLTAMPALAADEITSGAFSYIINESGSITITDIDENKCNSDVVVPDVLDGYTVTAIGEKAFMNAPITTVNIPASIETIGAGAFANCPLSQFIVSPANNTFTTIDGVLYNKTTKTLVAYPMKKTGEITIPEGILAIGDYAFYVELRPHHDVDKWSGKPYKRNDKNRFAMRYSSDNEIWYSIKWPSTLQTIGDYAFYGRDFTSEYVGATSSSRYDHNYFLLPDSVESIGDYAFSYCRFTLPEGDFVLNSYTITLAKGLKNIGEGCFKDAVIDNEDTDGTYTISIGGNVTDIADFAFYGFSATKACYAEKAAMTITLPPNTKNIGSGAFEKSIPVKGFNDVFPETIGENAFANTGFFETEITIHNSIKVISANAFSGLASVNEYDSFWDNRKQIPVKIVLEEGIETIEADAFAGQFYLSDVQLCSTLTEIGEGAFSGCKKLTSITIPSSVTSIGENAFEKSIFTISVYASSYAEQWCKENGYSYSIEGQNSLDWLNN